MNMFKSTSSLLHRQRLFCVNRQTPGVLLTGNNLATRSTLRALYTGSARLATPLLDIHQNRPYPSNPIISVHRCAFSSSPLSAKDIQKRLDGFQDLFVEARLCIEDVDESIGTKYFDEDAEAAQEAVNEAVAAFEQLISDIEDADEKNRVLRGNGLKVEQLKGELEMALKGGHDH
mmetsp:Transcript_105395/g.157780  ORF Transcript_105395/g.157780 Transcript_105395/m.157780 type:complete len:175 (-) Transcript_105395:160-684(-)